MVQKLTVCMGSSCFARGNENNLAVIENFLKTHNLTDEVDLFLESSLCRSNCNKGPVICLDGYEYEAVDALKTQAILQKILEHIKDCADE